MSKKPLIFAIVFALTLFLVFASGASAHEGEHCHWASGSEFGQHHAAMAQEGHFGAEHNPGNHNGYSACVR